MVLAHLPSVCAWFVRITVHVLAEYCIAFLIGKQASRYNKVHIRLHIRNSLRHGVLVDDRMDTCQERLGKVKFQWESDVK